MGRKVQKQKEGETVEKLAARLEKVRLARMMTQEDFAKALNINRTTLWMIRKGQHVKPLTVCKVEQALDKLEGKRRKIANA